MMWGWRVEEVRTLAWRLFKCWSLGKEGTVERQGLVDWEKVKELVAEQFPGGAVVVTE